MILSSSTPTIKTLPDEWQAGFNAYCDGMEYNAAASFQFLRGWNAAVNAEAEATVEYEEDMLDREFWRTGQW